MAVAIRRAISDDRPDIARLIERSARALSVGYYTPAETERAISRVFGVDSQLIADGTMYVAEIANRIVGCGGWSKRGTLYGGDQFADRTDDELDPRVDAARIRAFFVDPDFARRGIGRALLEACECAAADAGFTRAEMGATLPGVPLYAAFGYTAAEPIAIDMGDGHALRCVRMTKTFARGEDGQSKLDRR